MRFILWQYAKNLTEEYHATFGNVQMGIYADAEDSFHWYVVFNLDTRRIDFIEGNNTTLLEAQIEAEKVARRCSQVTSVEWDSC